jgi:hypothetical protein
MIVTHKLDVKWMKSKCKLHVDMTVVLTWCHAMSFVTIKLYVLPKATRGICNHVCDLQLKNNQENKLLICKFLVVIQG